MPDERVCIGDRYAIGSALFEVTQPRVTCFKVGIRLDEPRMPALLTGHGRPGFYRRVLEEGHLGAGDTIVKVADGLHSLNVQRVSSLLYTPDHEAETLRRALEVDALSEGWKWSFRRLLEQVEDGGGGNRGLTDVADERPAWTGFRRFRVTEAIADTDAVRSLWLEPEDGEPLRGHRPGQFVPVRVHTDEDGGLIRSYSLSALADGRRLRISVKREGQASAIVHDRVGAGAVVELGAPRGDFVLDVAGDRPVVAISAGIGVTPLLAMLAALAGSGSRRPVTWIHVARSGAEHALAGEARGLLARLPSARVHVRYTRPAPGDRPGVDFDAPGRLTAEDLAALDLAPDAEVFLCGRGLHGRRARRPGSRRFPARADSHGDVWRDSPARRPGASPAARTADRRAGRDLRAVGDQRPFRRPLAQPARAGRGVRRPRGLVLSHRRVPSLRERPRQRRSRIRPRAARPAERGLRAAVLRASDRRRHARPVGRNAAGTWPH